MKKILLFAFVLIFSLSAFAINPDSKSKSENPATPAKTENKISEEEVNSLTKRVEETADMDKSKQTIVVQDGHRHGRGHDRMNGDHRRSGGVIFLGGGSVLILIILIIVLM
jgi:hypothetical protein